MTHIPCLPGAGAGKCGGDPEPTKSYVRIPVFSTVWDCGASAMPPGENISPPPFKLWHAGSLVLVLPNPCLSDTCQPHQAAWRLRQYQTRMFCSFVLIFMVIWRAILTFPSTVATFIKQALLEPALSARCLMCCSSFHPHANPRRRDHYYYLPSAGSQTEAQLE